MRRKKKASAVLAAWAAFAVATLLASRATRHGAPPTAPELRPAREVFLNRHATEPHAYARVASLWSERASGAQCRIGAIWGQGVAPAAFAAQMRVTMSMPKPSKPAAAPAPWVTREQIQMAVFNAADVAQQFEPGASPVVRILRGQRFKPRRATFGAQEALAA